MPTERLPRYVYKRVKCSKCGWVGRRGNNVTWSGCPKCGASAHDIHFDTKEEIAQEPHVLCPTRSLEEILDAQGFLKAYSYSFAATYADNGYVFGTVAARTVGEARKSLLRHFREQGHTSVKEGDLRILQPSVAIEPGAILVAAEKA